MRVFTSHIAAAFYVGVVLSAALAPPPAAGQCEPVWTQRFDVPTQRRRAAMAFDSARGVIVMYGGENSQARINDTWEWQNGNWALRQLDSLPRRIDPALMAYDAARQR